MATEQEVRHALVEAFEAGAGRSTANGTTEDEIEWAFGDVIREHLRLWPSLQSKVLDKVTEIGDRAAQIAQGQEIGHDEFREAVRRVCVEGPTWVCMKVLEHIGPVEPEREWERL